MKTTTRILFPTSLLLGLCLLAAGPLAAQPRGLLSLEQRGLGGYGGPHFKPTVLNGQFALLGGGPIVLIFDRSWGMGLTVSSTEGDAAGLDLYYGDLRAERILFPGSLFSLSFGFTARGGWASFRNPASPGDPALRAGILLLEPETLVSLRILPGFRIGIGASYRLAFCPRGLAGIGSSELSGPAGIVQLQYGIWI